MTARIGINGFGRMGRLGLWAAWGCEELEFIQANEIAGDAASQEAVSCQARDRRTSQR